MANSGDIEVLKNQVSAQHDSIKFPEPNFLEAISRNYQYADYQYDLIIESIKEFEEALDEEHEVAVMLSSFGKSVTLSVTEIGYANPSLLFFHGYVGDSEATLIQHVSQLSFLLLAVKKSEPDKPPRRIGFAPPTED